MAVGQAERQKTETNVKKIIDGLKAGKTRESACAHAGISRQTFYNWLKDDPDFSTQVEYAEEYWIGIVEDQKRILVQDKQYWPAIEKELKSRKRSIYGDKSEVESTIKQETVSYNFDNLNVQELENIRKELLEKKD